MGRIIIGVMGPGTGASRKEMDAAYELGRQIAQQGWVTLSGGRACGVMDAVCRGAKSADGLTLGILPTENKSDASLSLDIAIPTGLGSARNNINALASDAIVACGMGAGTASEIALALKVQKTVILLNSTPEAQAFFSSLDVERVEIASTVNEAIEQIKRILSR
jgi:uncharacterized protein (TIGR00725 family)